MPLFDKSFTLLEGGILSSNSRNITPLLYGKCPLEVTAVNLRFIYVILVGEEVHDIIDIAQNSTNNAGLSATVESSPYQLD